MTNQVAVNWPDLKAAVPFYGGQPDPKDVPKIKAAMMLHYAGNDQRINQGIPAFEEALKKAAIEYKLYMYEGAEHAFHNDLLCVVFVVECICDIGTARILFDGQRRVFFQVCIGSSSQVWCSREIHCTARSSCDGHGVVGDL